MTLPAPDVGSADCVGKAEASMSTPDRVLPRAAPAGGAGADKIAFNQITSASVERRRPKPEYRRSGSPKSRSLPSSLVEPTQFC